MPTTCWPAIRGLAMRLTKTDSCGVPVAGLKNQVTSDGFISVKLTLEYEDGEETNQKNAAGKLCVVDKANDQLKYATAEISFCGVNPDLLSLATGQDLVVDETGAAVGISIGDPDDNTFWALETWSDVPGAACNGGLRPYGYFLLPFFGAGRIGDITIEEKLANFTMTATTRRGNGWGSGPYDVVLNPGAGESDPAVAGPLLVPLTSDKHLHMQVTTVAPPESACEAQALTVG